MNTKKQNFRFTSFLLIIMFITGTFVLQSCGEQVKKKSADAVEKVKDHVNSATEKVKETVSNFSMDDMHKKMMEELNLSEEQKGKIEAIHEGTMKEVGVLKEKMKDLDINSDEAKAIKKDICTKVDASHEKIKTLLTDEQKEKFDKFMTESKKCCTKKSDCKEKKECKDKTE